MKCFVIMGYGVKTDYTRGKPLDLDKTYYNIIKPVVESIGDLTCIRADEIPRTGVIDVEMYRLLLDADIVIADLSTYNCNALYELGIRHALKPRTTIVISEKELVYPFDLNHVVILKYEHLGTDIGYSEAMRFREELEQIIKRIIVEQKVDSPVYTYLCSLEPPRMISPANPFISSDDSSLRDLLVQATEAMDRSDFDKAISQLNAALAFDNNSTYIRQKLALATYKSGKPSLKESLHKALDVLSPLKPESTTDPETLGLHGAINKRLWELDQELDQLDKSISYYNRGFTIKRDYYNGINLAYLYNVRSSLSTGDEKITDCTLANRIRKEVIEICNCIIDQSIEDREDRYWIYATLEEAYYALGDNYHHAMFKEKALGLNPSAWKIESTENQINKLKNLLNLENK